MIAIIDYSAGNLANVVNALQGLGYRAEVTACPTVVARAEAVILPGVGAFDHAVRVLRSQKLDLALQQVLNKGVPLLGICLGLQLLFSSSEEGEEEPGLDFFRGRVRRLPPQVKVPHMGWNTLQVLSPKDPLLAGIEDNSYFYFAHSYYADPEDRSPITATTAHGQPLAASLAWNNIWGVQFHPEKSGQLGLKLLDNFARLSQRRFKSCS